MNDKKKEEKQVTKGERESDILLYNQLNELNSKLDKIEEKIKKIKSGKDLDDTHV